MKSKEDRFAFEGVLNLYEDDGLLILYVPQEYPGPSIIENVIGAGHNEGWRFYVRLDKHDGVYLIFLF